MARLWHGTRLTVDPSLVALVLDRVHAHASVDALKGAVSAMEPDPMGDGLVLTVELHGSIKMTIPHSEAPGLKASVEAL